MLYSNNRLLNQLIILLIKTIKKNNYKDWRQERILKQIYRNERILFGKTNHCDIEKNLTIDFQKKESKL